MNKTVQFYTGQRFSLPLKSRSEKKRVLEAKESLSGIYPFSVEADNILVSKTGRKGVYDVYVSKEKVRRTGRPAKFALALAVLFAMSLVAGFYVRLKMQKKEMDSMAQKEMERQKAEGMRILKEKEEALESLENEYDKKASESYGKIYPCMERIYIAIGENSTVENISISRDSFSIEVTTKDAVRILRNFEGSAVFRSVKMNRSTVRGRTETVTYSGEFSRTRKKADERLGIDDKISFYAGGIDAMNARRERLRALRLSEYIKGIRDLLRRNGCSEQYIQLRGGEKTTEVEFFVLSSSRSILNFIKAVQDGEDNLVDIRQIRIRNSEVRNRVQTSICFDSGIEPKDNDSLFPEYSGKKIGVSDIDKIFCKAPARKAVAAGTQAGRSKPSAVKPAAAKASGQTARTSTSARLKKLSYVGLTKTGGKAFVIAKDDEMGSIYKIPLCGQEAEGDFCTEAGSGYTARIRGTYYEVKR